VELDRERIERKDFTIRRRGYDPAEVDAHLAAVADRVEELRRSLRSSGETSAAAASEHVRAIVETAEASASEVRPHASQAGRETAPLHAAGPRTNAREPTGEDAETKPAMLGRLEALQSELKTLIESLRAGDTPAAAGLQTLESNLREVRDAGQRGVRREPAQARAPGVEETKSSANGRFVAEVEPQVAPEKTHGDRLAGDRDDARLIALNMALNGTSREETERYLAQNFELPDRRGLVDEVYATVEG
jgi:DivIVA domain-containing protein